MSNFRIFYAGRHVEEAVILTLLKWGQTWIAETERQNNIEPRKLPVPQRGQFTTISEVFLKWPEDQTPVVLVISRGLDGPPRVEADRSLTAPVVVDLGFIASSGFYNAAREVAQLLAAAYSQVLLRHPLEELETDGVEYLGERYGDLPTQEDRFMGAARLSFRIWVKNWRNERGGPINRDEPPDDPYQPGGTLPTVHPDRINVTIDPVRRID